MGLPESAAGADAVPEQVFAAVLDIAADAVLRLDRAGVVTWGNRAARRILGRSEAELVGTRLLEVLSEADAAALGAVLDRSDVGRGEDLQICARRSDDQRVPLVLSVARDTADGGPGGWWVVARDLTEQHDWQRTLAEGERRVRRGEALAGTGSFVVDPAAATVQWSAGMYVIFDVVPGQFEPSLEAYLDLVHAEDRADVRAAIANALAGQSSTELDHRACLSDGSLRWVFLAIEPTCDAAGLVIGLSGVCQDITVRKRATLAMRTALDRERAAMDELRRLDRAKEEFLATVSHELRTPLTAILGFSTLARSVAPEHDPMLAPIERNALAMHHMVERLLDYSRLEAGRVAIEARSIGLADQVATALRQLQSELAGRAVQISVPADLFVWADPDALQRILVNLLGNAAKYSDPPAAIGIRIEPGGQGTVVTVYDEGPGIDAAHQAQIFERFFRVPGAARSRRGTGVGLAIVRQYVELHGGQVWVDSVPGKGASFHFDLAIGGGGGE
jgi:PAS domain S-box-containing protein